MRLHVAGSTVQEQQDWMPPIVAADRHPLLDPADLEE
jgi:hypothetical protein